MKCTSKKDAYDEVTFSGALVKRDTIVYLEITNKKNLALTDGYFNKSSNPHRSKNKEFTILAPIALHTFAKQN